MAKVFLRLFVLLSVLGFALIPAPAWAQAPEPPDLPNPEISDKPKNQADLLAGETITCEQRAEQINQARVEPPLPADSLVLRPLSVAATNPSINVRLPLTTGWSEVYGTTAASATVTLRVLRSGQETASVETTSEADGSYRFTSTWVGCGLDEGWNWTVSLGDVVEVSAGENTAQVEVTALTAWLDPQSGLVAGSAQPGWVISAVLYQDTTACTLAESVDKAATMDAAGAFTIDYSAEGFDRSATAYVFSFDAQGNSVYGYYSAFHILIDLDEQRVYGSLYPAELIEVAWARNDVPQGSWSVETETDGSFWTPLNTGLFPGDEITITGRDTTVTARVAPFAVSYAPGGENQIVGQADPGARVRVNTAVGEEPIPGQCALPAVGCGTVAADANGNFTFTVDRPLARGEQVWFNVYDAEGNWQQARRPVPLIIADLSTGWIGGFWGGAENSLSISLIGADGVEKDSLPEVPVALLEREFGAQLFSALPAPGDTIQVSAGELTESMVVGDFSAHLDAAAKTLTGTAPAGRLVVGLYDFRLGVDEPVFECQVLDVDGAYTAGFSPQAQIGGQDLVEAFAVGSDGHLAYRPVGTLVVSFYPSSNAIGGYATEPGAIINISLYAGETLLEQQTITSSADFWYGAIFDTLFEAGQRAVAVQGEAAASAEISLPALSFTTDPASNSVSGMAVPNEPVRVVLRSSYACGDGEICGEGITRWATANPDGTYQVSFADSAFNTRVPGWDREVCTPGLVDGLCSEILLYYYPANENSVLLTGPSAQPVTADAAEADDTAAAAKPYQGQSRHTFHSDTDVDWVSFIVSAEQVGQPFTLQTANLGRTADTLLALYDQDGTTQLALDDDSGLNFASKITWIPDAAGTYLLQVSPYAPANTATCDASYDLSITVGLPLEQSVEELAFNPFVK